MVEETIEKKITILGDEYLIDEDTAEQINEFLTEVDGLKEEGDLEGAIRVYSKLIEAFPDYPPAYNNRAYAYMKLGKYELALHDINQAIKVLEEEMLGGVHPDMGLFYCTRAEINASIGNKEAFYEDLETATIKYRFDVSEYVDDKIYQPFVNEERFKDILRMSKVSRAVFGG